MTILAVYIFSGVYFSGIFLVVYINKAFSSEEGEDAQKNISCTVIIRVLRIGREFVLFKQSMEFFFNSFVGSAFFWV